jgi:chorismate mutase/prephenate dehydratase
MKKPSQQLSRLRQRIDSLDEQLVKLVNERARIALQVGAAKKDVVKFSPSREAEVIAHVKAVNAGPLADAVLEAIMRDVISGCLGLEQPMRVSYLGPEGTYSEEAACRRFGAMAALVPCASIDETVLTVEKGQADVAVVPIENSTEGSVSRTLDLLFNTRLQICAEVLLPIRHQLLSNDGRMEAITEVVAHSQSLAQCRSWLAGHLPGATLRPVVSNGEAARIAIGEAGCAAIASQRAAEHYGLAILAKNIEDDPSNTTRFLVLGNVPTKSTGADKTSLICSVPNKAGTLQKLLAILAEENINMVRLESRPARQELWDYLFYIDIDGHKDDEHAAKALRRFEEQATFVKVIGSYPKATL